MNHSAKPVKTAFLKLWAFIAAGLAALALLMAFSVTKGTAEIPLETVFNSIFRFDSQNMSHLIIIDLRLPRVISSALVGSALAVAVLLCKG